MGEAASVPRRPRFHYGVLQRVLIVALLAAILPVAIAGLLSHRQITDRLEHQAETQMREMAKSYGLGVLERLKLAAQDARLADGGIGSVSAGLGDRVSGIREIRLDELENMEGWQAGDYLGLGGWRSGEGRRPVLVVRPGDCCAADLMIAVPRDGGRVLLIDLNPDYVWGVAGNLPYRTDLCVFTQDGETLFCNRPVAGELRRVAGTYDGLIGRTRIAWSDDDRAEHIASLWELFLAGDFVAAPWTFVVSRPVSDVHETAASFGRIFAPVLALVVLLVIVLVSRLVRSSLAPLGSLTEATERLSDGDLAVRVDVPTRDEFHQLAGSFNTMAARLAEQFQTLDGLSQLDHMMLRDADLDELAGVVLEQLQAAANPDCAAVTLVDGFSADAARILLRTRQGPLEVSRCAVDADAWSDCGGLMHIFDAGSGFWPHLPERMRASGCSHVIVQPVTSEEGVGGLLLLGYLTRPDVTVRALERVGQLADRLALAQSAAERDEALYRQAHFDPLTGLPNRQLMMDRLQQQILYAGREGVRGAVLFIDLDRFKQINDVWGHGVGDQLLFDAGQRIREAARSADTVARIGGDEFVVVLSSIDSSSDASLLADRLIRDLSAVYRIGGNEHFVSASIGITLFPDDGDSVERILKHADTAMYRAKEAGRGRMEFFNESMNRETIQRVEIERELRQALTDGSLSVYYQPQIDLATGRPFGVEALVRWEHPERGFISPAEFIPIAEDSGLIVRLGEWVFRTACAHFLEWTSQGLELDCLSINVSRRQFHDPEFVPGIVDGIRQIGVDPGLVELEITETAVADDLGAVIESLEKLREAGLRIAIDDFGVGYSSLSQLQQLPFDTLKIDKSFVDHVADPASGSRAIVRTIVALAEHMGKNAIAEGVEQPAQESVLRADGCRLMQGYLYSRPVRADELPSRIEMLGRRSTEGLSDPSVTRMTAG